MTKGHTYGVFGPDGAGKTTIVNAATRNLAKLGRQYEVTWHRSSNLLTLPLFVMFRMLRYSSRLSLKGESHMHLDLSSHPLWFSLFSVTVAVDYLLGHWYRRIRYGLRRGNVIYDRFAWDTIVDLCVISGRSLDMLQAPHLQMLRKIAESYPSVLVLAPRDELIKRRPIVSLDPLFQRRIELYDEIAKRYRVPVVYNDGPLEDCVETLIAALHL